MVVFGCLFIGCFGYLLVGCLCDWVGCWFGLVYYWLVLVWLCTVGLIDRYKFWWFAFITAVCLLVCCCLGFRVG